MSLILFTQRYVFYTENATLFYQVPLFFNNYFTTKFTQSKSLPLPFFNDLIIINNNAISFIFISHVYQYVYLSHVFIIDIRPIKFCIPIDILVVYLC